MTKNCPALACFTLLCLAVAPGCGGPASDPTPAPVSPAGCSPQTTPCPVDAGPPAQPIPDAGQPASVGNPATADAGTATGTSAVNQASELWNLQGEAEGDAKLLSDGYGDPAVAWLQAATTAANASQMVRFGTVSQAGNGTITYSPSPTDRLVINGSTGWTATLTNLQFFGNTSQVGFPSCSQCLLRATWSDSNAALQLEVGQSHETFDGWFFTAAGMMHVVSLTTTWTHDIFMSGNSSDSLKVTGTVTTAQARVTVKREVFTGELGTGPFLFVTSLTSITRGPVTTVLDTYRGTFMQLGQPLPHLIWTGTATQNGVAVGGLQWKVLSSSSSSKLVQMLLTVGTDSVDLGSISIDPTADIAYDSRRS